jgi:hypothetical protein
MKKTEIICNVCGEKVEKNKAEIDRQKKRGRTTFYCSLKCSGKNDNNIRHLTNYQDNFKKIKYTKQPDQYSNFKWYIKVVRKNAKEKNHQYNIDCEYLKQLWDEQNGICPFTNQHLTLRTHSNNDIKKYPYQASLDILDNNKGYIKGNVRFVALIYNYARNIFSDEEVIQFCKMVSNNFIEEV